MVSTKVSIECYNPNQQDQCLDVMFMQNTQFLYRPWQCHAKPLQHNEHDLLTLMDFINNNDDDNPCPVGLLGGGEHFIDIPEGRQGTMRRSQ